MSADLTVDQLAQRVGMTVRNVRAYAARGLLPPPRLRGRTGYYGSEHVARLSLVRDLLAQGYTLAAVEKSVAGDASPLALVLSLAWGVARLSRRIPAGTFDEESPIAAQEQGLPKRSGALRPGVA